METGKAAVTGKRGVTPREATRTSGPTGVMAVACLQREIRSNTGSPRRCGCDLQPEAREGQAGPPGVADGFVVPRKPGNAGGGKGPEFKTGVGRGTRARRLAMSLETPRTVQKPRVTPHATGSCRRREFLSESRMP